MSDSDNNYTDTITIQKAIKLIDNGFLDEYDLDKLPLKLGITEKQLKRLFKSELNSSPQEYALNYKLTLVRQLLMNTTNLNLNWNDVAKEWGFKNLKYLKEVYENQLNESLTPLNETNDIQRPLEMDETIQINIDYKRPYRYEALLGHLSFFSIKGVERVENGKYYKTLRIKKNQHYLHGYIIVANNASQDGLVVQVSTTLIPVLPNVVARVKNIFDLYCDPVMVNDHLQKVNSVVDHSFQAGTRIPGSADDFEMGVRAVIGQLISLKNASDVLAAFCQKFGEKIETKIEGLDTVFPTPEVILAIERENIYDEICSLHITRSKTNAIVGLAEGFCQQTLNLTYGVDGPAILQQLLKVKGIGKWTADYIVLRSVSYADILMDTDYNIRKVYDHVGISDSSIFNAYSPWRSYLTVGLLELIPTLPGKPSETLYKTYYSSPIGELLIASKHNKLIGVWVKGQKHYLSNYKEKDMQEKEDEAILVRAKAWFDQYFRGANPSLDSLTLAPVGSKLRQDVWNILKGVPYGHVITFNHLGQKLIQKRGIKKVPTQAIKEALSHNPLAIIIPCHRVIGTNGTNTNYAGGVKAKTFLLKHEKKEN